MAFLSYLVEARDLFYKHGQPVRAESTLRPCLKRPMATLEEKRAVFELMGLILRAQNRFEDAIKIYSQIDDQYQLGYCALLRGDVRRVQQAWTDVLAKQPNHWCLTLYGLVTRQLQTCPSLLQIRHYIEGDIANLVAAKQLTYLENLLFYVEFLSQLNLETPKFVGRSLMHAGRYDKAGDFLIQAQALLPNDPEIYYHLGQYGAAQNQIEQARIMLQQCLMISPTYTPAAELLATFPD